MIETYPLEAGHFALDTAADEIAALAREFVASSRQDLLSRRSVEDAPRTVPASH